MIWFHQHATAFSCSVMMEKWFKWTTQNTWSFLPFPQVLSLGVSGDSWWLVPASQPVVWFPIRFCCPLGHCLPSYKGLQQSQDSLPHAYCSLLSSASPLWAQTLLHYLDQ